MSGGGSTAAVSSELKFRHVCDPCSFEDTPTEGVAFCQVCKEYLCNDCLRVHKNSKASRTHVLLGKDELHKANKDENEETRNNMCDVHDEAIVKFCRTHGQVICSKCLTTYHETCKDIVNIREICTTEAGPKETSDFLTNLHALADKFRRLEVDQTYRRDRLTKQKEKCVHSVKKLRTELNSLLDKLEGRIYKDVAIAVEKESNLISSDVSRIKKTVVNLEAGIEQVEIARQTGAFDAFISMKKVRLETASQFWNDVTKERYDVVFNFDPDAMLTKLTQELKEFGKMRVERISSRATAAEKTQTAPINSLTADLRDMKLVRIGQFNVKDVDDLKKCGITGAKFLPSGELLVCDSYNSAVKLFSPRLTRQATLKLPEGPWELTLTSDNEVAITLPLVRKIRFLTVSEGNLILQEDREIKIEKQCYGIACRNKHLFVSCRNPSSEVIVLNLQGQIEVRVPNTDRFKCPYHIAVDEDFRLYVTDEDTHTMTCMTTSGKVVYTSATSDNDVTSPAGLLVDSGQSVYVCGYYSHNLTVIAFGGKDHKSLVKRGEGVVNPESIAFRSSDKLLVVGMCPSNNIVCFRFE